MISALQRYYPSSAEEFDEDLNDVVDFIQDGLECCGIINGTVDWMIYSPFYTALNRVPGSCCGLEDEEECNEEDIFEDVSYHILLLLCS